MKRDCVCPRARHQHGTLAAYASDKCRCFLCRVAHANAARTYRNGGSVLETLTDATGTVRRLQALMAIGLSQQQIGEHLGVTSDAVSKLMGRDKVISGTAERVSAVYDQLWDQPQHGRVAKLIRSIAARRGYLPPQAYDDDTIDIPSGVVHIGYEFINPERDAVHKLCTPTFIDEIAVERACDGDNVPLTRAEMSHAIDTLGRMGYGADETARRLRISGRTVVRHRTKDVA